MPTPDIRPKRLILWVVGWRAGRRRFKARGSRNWKLHPGDGWSIAPPGMCLHGVSLSDLCDLCLRVSEINGGGSAGIPDDPDATVLVDCSVCPTILEAGCRGIDDALSQGWEIDAAGDLVCMACSEARAEIVGDER